MKVFSLNVSIFLVWFVSSSSAIIIDCFYDNELFFDDLKVAYTCTAKNLVTNASNRNITNVTGGHLSSHSDDDITQLHIYRQRMEYFPRGFTNFFDNVVAIHAGMNGLRYLEKNDLKEFTKLRFLYLYSNLLENLQSDVFQYNNELEYVSFYNNHLKHVGSKILTPLKKLRTAYFNKNICIDKQAVHSEQGISELRLEIADRCSDITDEDLMITLKITLMKVNKLEFKLAEIYDQLTSVHGIVKSMKSDNKTV